MKIIAVIPARAGSKGIPNKNIRIIQGRPMIYYAIHNAIEAQMVTVWSCLQIHLKLLS